MVDTAACQNGATVLTASSESGHKHMQTMGVRDSCEHVCDVGKRAVYIIMGMGSHWVHDFACSLIPRPHPKIGFFDFSYGAWERG